VFFIQKWAPGFFVDERLVRQTPVRGADWIKKKKNPACPEKKNIKMNTRMGHEIILTIHTQLDEIREKSLTQQFAFLREYIMVCMLVCREWRDVIESDLRIWRFRQYIWTNILKGAVNSHDLTCEVVGGYFTRGFERYSKDLDRVLDLEGDDGACNYMRARTTINVGNCLRNCTRGMVEAVRCVKQYAQWLGVELKGNAWDEALRVTQRFYGFLARPTITRKSYRELLTDAVDYETPVLSDDTTEDEAVLGKRSRSNSDEEPVLYKKKVTNNYNIIHID